MSAGSTAISYLPSSRFLLTFLLTVRELSFAIAFFAAVVSRLCFIKWKKKHLKKKLKYTGNWEIIQYVQYVDGRLNSP
jgi:hypothetical protein